MAIQHIARNLFYKAACYSFVGHQIGLLLRSNGRGHYLNTNTISFLRNNVTYLRTAFKRKMEKKKHNYEYRNIASLLKINCSKSIIKSIRERVNSNDQLPLKH